MFNELVHDKSWRVRQKVAEIYGKLQEAFLKTFPGNKDVESELINGASSLLKDIEGEVRASGSKNLGIICSQWPKATKVSIIIETFLPIITNLVDDPNPPVKEALGENLVDIAEIIGRESAIKEILPLLTGQLRDESSEVRFNVISQLKRIDDLVGIETLSKQVLPVILELSEDQKWRIRLAILENIPTLAKQLGKGVFEAKLFEIVMTSVDDSIFNIREAACICLADLALLFGEQFTNESIIPKMSELSSSGNYLKRITCLIIGKELMKKNSCQLSAYINIVKTLTNDKVPNVRFNVAKTLAVAKNTNEATAVKACLTELKKDEDRDVVFYAEDALAQLGF